MCKRVLHVESVENPVETVEKPVPPRFLRAQRAAAAHSALDKAGACVYNSSISQCAKE